VLLMSPMPAHGRDASLFGQIAMTLLDHDGREYDAYTPITMEVPEESGIEPDYCFYIDNWQAVSGKQRINWQQDPPPDLAIEVDVTSYSDVDDYLPYKVPELWLWKKQSLKIYQFQAGQYVLQTQSRWFPGIDITAIVETVVKETYDRNSSFAIRNLRQRLTAEELIRAQGFEERSKRLFRLHIDDISLTIELRRHRWNAKDRRIGNLRQHHFEGLH
jgi:hypothetical protein